MTTNEKAARRKLSLLELAGELNNVNKACKLIGFCVFREVEQPFPANVNTRSLTQQTSPRFLTRVFGLGQLTSPLSQ